MTIPEPTTDEIAATARELGYDDVADSAEEYTQMITGMLGVYEALDAIDDPEVLVSRGPVACRRPSATEDPHHAWQVRASISEVESGPLAGVRLAVKDSIMVAGLPMANGSDVLADFVPTGDATVVTRALQAGAEIVGKTTNEYFCMSGGSHTSHGGPVHNPHRMGVSAGGSSSGSAVVLVTGDADMALGADQAGSIRMPASWSGVVGLKPTYGLVPYTGIAPLEGMLDHVGPMTRTVTDNARLLAVLAGPDGIDPRQRDVRTENYEAAVRAGVRGMRVGVVTEGFDSPDAEAAVTTSVRSAADSLRAAGAVVEDVSIPLHNVGPALWTAIAIEGMAETVTRNQGFAFGRDDHYPTDMMGHLFDRRDRVGGRPANVALFTMVGHYVNATSGRLHYARAVNKTRVLRAAYDEALSRFDVLVMPTTPQTAQPLPDPAAGPMASVQAAIEMSSNACPFNITHHPALSVPCGTVDGLPVGLQIVGRHFDEPSLYRVGRAVEQHGGGR